MSYSEIQHTLTPVLVELSFSRWLEIVVRLAG